MRSVASFDSFCHTAVGSKKATPLRTGNKTAPARRESLVTLGGEDQSESDAEQPWQPGHAHGSAEELRGIETQLEVRDVNLNTTLKEETIKKIRSVVPEQGESRRQKG